MSINPPFATSCPAPAPAPETLERLAHFGKLLDQTDCARIPVNATAYRKAGVYASHMLRQYFEHESVARICAGSEALSELRAGVELERQLLAGLRGSDLAGALESL